MALSDKERLLELARALPLATPDQFFGGRRPPPDASPEDIRTISDTSLRTRLIEARVAEGLQSPKGPQKIASIVRIYPNFDGPGKVAAGSVPRKLAPSARGKATVDEMQALLDRIRSVEADVARELQGEIDAKIDRVKKSLANLEGPELEAAYRELGDALARKRSTSAEIHREAFRRIERDATFPPRLFLRFIE